MSSHLQYECNMMSGCGDNGWERIDQSEASIRRKITGVQRYAIGFCILPWRSVIPSMKSMGPIVLEKTSGNQESAQMKGQKDRGMQGRKDTRTQGQKDGKTE